MGWGGVGWVGYEERWIAGGRLNNPLKHRQQYCVFSK